MNTRWLWAAAVGCGLVAVAGGCATARGDVTGSGDDRIDESGQAETAAEAPDGDGAPAAACGPEVPTGGITLLDGRSAEPISCVLATVLREQAGCAPEAGGTHECPTEQVARGPTSAAGRLPLNGTDPAATRLWAVAEGFAQSPREPGPVGQGRTAEIEMVPEAGFLLKLLDGEGNYLPGLAVVFRQGEAVLAQMKTNDLSNVYFAERTPFAGEPVVIEAEGFLPVTVTSPADLGADGNTLTLRR